MIIQCQGIHSRLLSEFITSPWHGVAYKYIAINELYYKILMKQYTKEFIDELMKQVQEEYSLSELKTKEKKQFFRKNLALYLNKVPDSKIADRTIFRYCDMLAAVDHKFKPKVKFSPRDLGDEMIAKNRERIHKFDYDEMDRWRLDYWKTMHKYLFWVGISVRDWFDTVSGKPKYRIVHPLDRTPDVNFDPNYGFRYHWFDWQDAKSSITEENWFFNIDAIKTQKQQQSDRSIEQQQNQQAKQDHRMISTDLWGSSTNDNGYFYGYTHYTRYKGIRYIVDCSNERANPIRIQEIEPVYAEEKKDPSKIHPGVIIERWRPLDGDPWGISLAFDLLADKQKNRQALYNLNLIKAKYEALGDIYLYDPEVIKDPSILAKPSDNPRYIPAANLVQNPNPLIELPKQRIKNDSALFPDILGDMASRDVSMDERTMGVSGQWDITKGESDRVQMNTNLRHMLGINFAIHAEKEFIRHVYLRSYYEHFKEGEEKFLYLTTGVGQVPITVKRKDFITENDINFSIASPLDDEEKEKNERELALAFYPTLFQNASSDYGRKELTRHFGKLLWMNEEFLRIVIAETSEETQAKLDLVLLNQWKLPKVHSLTEDHNTYIAIFNQAIDWPAKFSAIQMRIQAKLLAQQQMQQQQVQDSGMPQAQQNMMTANAIGKMNSDKTASPSLQDITA